MKKTLVLATLASAASLATAAPASAEILTFKATDFTGGAHGLWTNQFNTPSQRRYSFQDDVYFTVDTDAGTATLTGTAINSVNAVAVLDIAFSGFLESTFGTDFQYKQEQGAAYDEVNDINDVDFFTTLTGNITIDGTVFSLDDPAVPTPYAFQYGLGANGKNVDEFGGSTWLQIDGQNSNWDLNFNLTATAVPEPGTWLMMILGFGAVAGAMRSGKRQARMRVAYN